jgi:tetratricopeptide (TPR) repeat protein
MVAIGWRITNEQLLEQLARRVRSSSSGRVDDGAALCVLAYRALLSPCPPSPEICTEFADSIERYVDGWNPANPHETRWVISNLYVKACLLRNVGDRDGALIAFKRCASIDPLSYSPLLATKSVSACWLAGLLSFHAQDLDAARRFWSRGIALAEHALKGDWREICGSIDRPFTFGLKEASEILNTAAQCADALNHTAIHGTLKSLPTMATLGSLQRLAECERQLNVARENLDNILASPASRLHSAVAQDAPLYSRLIRISYLLATILLPDKAKRLLRPAIQPLKRWYENRQQ